MRPGAFYRVDGGGKDEVFFSLRQAVDAFRLANGPTSSPAFFEVSEWSPHGPWARGLFREVNLPLYEARSS